MPWPRTTLEEKCLSPIRTKLGYDLALILAMGKLRFRELARAQTGTPSDILNYDPSGRKIRVFRGFGKVLLGVREGDPGRLVPGLTEGKGQPGC